MEFTKEEIETAKKIYEKYITDKFNEKISSSYIHFLDLLLKPERKKIRVEIEYESDNFPLTADRIKGACELKYDITFRKFKVTELPEVFSKEDLIELGNKIIFNIQCNKQIYPYNQFGNDDLEFFLSERKSK
jgi:hypothetical protein